MARISLCRHALSLVSRPSPSLLRPVPAIYGLAAFPRSFASKASAATEEPLRTLDDITFTYTPSKTARPEVDVKATRRQASRELWQQKMERGRRRADERRAKLLQERQLAADFRGINEQDNPTRAILPLLPELSESEQSALLLLSSPHTANARQLRTMRLQNILRRFSKTPGDTGSPEVQCAVLTERIAALRAHVKARNKDIKSRRTLAVMEEKRRAQLKYLRRRNTLSYEMVMKECRISVDEVDAIGRNAESGNQAKRPPRSG